MQKIYFLNHFVAYYIFYCIWIITSFAFGLGDGRIYYWNVSNKRQLELITLSQSVDSKVLSVSLTD